MSTTAQAEHLPIYKASYDLCLYLEQVVRGFSRTVEAARIRPDPTYLTYQIRMRVMRRHGRGGRGDGMSSTVRQKGRESIMTISKQRVFAALVATLVLMTSQAQAVDPADKCEADKNKAVAKYAVGRQKVVSQFAKVGQVPVTSDYEKPDATFSVRWAKVEDQAEGMCPTTGDVDALGNLVRVFTETARRALRPVDAEGGMPSALPQTGPTQCDQGDGTLGDCVSGSPPGQDGEVLAGMARSYTDNGDGTITDNVMRLMWEKLSDDGSIHDWDDTYSWYDAFNGKIESLNDSAFAGHADWRLPNRFELETLVDLGRFSPAIDPEFDTSCAEFCTVTTCSCTPEAALYWSSTSAQLFPDNAWFVGFASGEVQLGSKGDLLFVRAVRPGS